MRKQFENKNTTKQFDLGVFVVLEQQMQRQFLGRLEAGWLADRVSGVRAARSAAPLLERTIEMDKKFANLDLGPTREVKGDL